ncbi:hypothetical protein HOB91_03710 [Candidatus Woesearchaeota archaeon]|jgi:hypothetical protein|nr:hypothetical protein [Candidatus Woesearchaeota archaeon]MBT6402229.1 hypothetical protein [Candidatus Woesearchaeota archaeon]
MRNYKPEEIAETRTFLEKKGCPEISVGGRDFKYFVVPQSLNPELPNFVLRRTGNSPSDGSVYGISSNVRPDFRKYAVFHELIEFGELGINAPGRCRTALDIELKVVPEEIRSDYVAMRTQFFKDLIGFFENNPAEFNPGDLKEIRDSLSGLEALV